MISNRYNRLTRGALLAGVATLLLAAPATAQQDPIQIGFTTAITGPFNEFGEGYRRGAEIAAEQWNARGGIDGRPVALGMVLDDQLVPDRSVQNMRRILDNPDIAALIAPSGSGPTLAIIDMVEADGRPMCNTQAQTPLIIWPNGLDQPPRRNVFSVSIGNTVEADKLGEALVAGQYNHVGILHESTGYGVTGAEILKSRLEELDPNVTVTVESYNQRAPDMTAQLARAQRAGADVLVVIGLGADLAVIRRNIARLNLAIPLYATAGGVTPPYIEGAGELTIGTRAASSAVMAANPYPAKTQEVLDAYVAKHGRDRWWGPDQNRAQIAIASTMLTGYDCANLLFSAIERAGSTDPDAVIAAMQETRDFPGASIESISFSPEDHDAMTTAGLTVYEMQSTPAGLTLVPRETAN
ncbi:MAG: amino acid-binding protein [Salinarimonadaceae bacterium]|nr:MAG: amino acid-binding protein [Salinarimonadaceae bacterium]